MAYLSRLEGWILTHHHPDGSDDGDDGGGAWHSPPSLEPISIVGYSDPRMSVVVDASAEAETPSRRRRSMAHPSAPPRTGSGRDRDEYGASNPYACIASSDDEDDDAGDEVLLEPTTSTTSVDVDGMTLLRLLIRIRTTMGDLWSHQSGTLAYAHEWADACAFLIRAITSIREAMHLADGQISRYFQYEREDGPSVRQRRALEEDADIVHVAIQSVVRTRDRYQDLAHRRMRKLERELLPQWESRDEVKNRMGRERWKSNPNPKCDYAALRIESERELRGLQEALESLDEAGVDELEKSALSMKCRLRDDGVGHRYNGRRPEDVLHTIDVGRVGGDHYPDATEYGWTFTGSNPASRVEFFEKIFDHDDDNDGDGGGGGGGGGLIKLDWYYTAATIKTAMDHPLMVKTQLFAKEGLTPDLYMQILENPRVHTEVRYQRKGSSKKKKKKKSGKNCRNYMQSK